MHDEHIAAGLELQYYRIRALGGVLRHFGKGSLLHARHDVGYTCDILHSLQIEDDLMYRYEAAYHSDSLCIFHVLVRFLRYLLSLFNLFSQR